MVRYAKIHNNNNTDIAIKYYLMAIQNGHIVSLWNLSILYYKINDTINAKKMLLEYINIAPTEIDMIEALQQVELWCKSPIVSYNLIYKIVNKNNDINKILQSKIKELQNSYPVICYMQKIKLLGKVEECPICFHIKINIPLECVHYVCIDCYTKIEKCPFKCNN
jgi:hypothetical protein